MKVKVRFYTGNADAGVLTTEHSQSSYGIPVFVPTEAYRIFDPITHKPTGWGDVFSATDLERGGCAGGVTGFTEFELDQEEIPTDEEIEQIKNAGFRINFPKKA